MRAINDIYEFRSHSFDRMNASLFLMNAHTFREAQYESTYQNDNKKDTSDVGFFMAAPFLKTNSNTAQKHERYTQGKGQHDETDRRYKNSEHYREGRRDNGENRDANSQEYKGNA